MSLVSMKYIVLIASLFMIEPLTLFDFTQESNLSSWYIVNDTVMGGRSDATFEINEEGHGFFQGKVSLENNGGFASVRHLTNTLDLSNHTQVQLTIKGDGSRYQLRLQEDSYDRFSYIQYFETNGQWQKITLPLKDFEPWYRGRYLQKPNFSGTKLSELSILVGNKKEQNFQLQIDKIQFIE